MFEKRGKRKKRGESKKEMKRSVSSEIKTI